MPHFVFLSSEVIGHHARSGTHRDTVDDQETLDYWSVWLLIKSQINGQHRGTSQICHFCPVASCVLLLVPMSLSGGLPPTSKMPPSSLGWAPEKPLHLSPPPIPQRVLTNRFQKTDTNLSFEQDDKQINNRTKESRGKQDTLWSEIFNSPMQRNVIFRGTSHKARTFFMVEWEHCILYLVISYYASEFAVSKGHRITHNYFFFSSRLVLLADELLSSSLNSFPLYSKSGIWGLLQVIHNHSDWRL